MLTPCTRAMQVRSPSSCAAAAPLASGAQVPPAASNRATPLSSPHPGTNCTRLPESLSRTLAEARTGQWALERYDTNGRELGCAAA